MERFIEKNGKRLRYGYTTGSCAAAAAKAAALELIEGDKSAIMTIDTPKGWVLDIEVFHVARDSKSTTCYVVKDAGDDPDVTNGIEVYATVQLSDAPGVHIEGGLGVGRVTKRGLRVSVGEAAINPVPLEMITSEVGKVLADGQGVDVIIFVPEGVEVAKRTFNPKLGIIGGISILGTTGIVEPMSEDAFSDSLEVELSVLAIESKGSMAYVFGNFGRDYLGDSFPEAKVQKTSNFVEIMMKAAAKTGLGRILYVGHIGKMVKVAYGMPNTHSKYGDNRMISLVNCGEVVGLEEVEKEALLSANTTDEAVEMLITFGKKDAVMKAVVHRCKNVLEAMSGHQVSVECKMFSTIYGTLAETEGTHVLLEELVK